MTSAIIIAVFVFVVMSVLLFEILRTPAGIEQDRFIRQGRIFSRTRAVVHAGCDEVIHLLQTDWSWWKKARAETMTDLGNGQKEFLFHPVRFFGVIELPITFLVRLESVEPLADGGKRIHATLTGDFEGHAEYSTRPGRGGTTVELAWEGAEVRGFLRFMPLFTVASVHCWRERLGVEGLRDRLESLYAATEISP